MKVLVSGASGYVGRYIVEGLLEAGYAVIAGGRNLLAKGLFSKPVGYVPLSLDPDLDQIESFEGVDFFVHAAFDHLPGRYRGGEGDDVARFLRLNRDGTRMLFETARRAGTRRAIFLSSRAVYDGLSAERLTEDMQLHPDTVYGRMKLDCEQAIRGLSQSGFVATSLRATGIYGDLRPNKWDELIENFQQGQAIDARAATEAHGSDVAAAVRLMLETDATRIDGESFNLSDLVIERRDILAYFENVPHPLPPSDGRKLTGIMDTGKLQSLGWRPGGRQLFDESMKKLAASFNAMA